MSTGRFFIEKFNKQLKVLLLFFFWKVLDKYLPDQGCAFEKNLFLAIRCIEIINYNLMKSEKLKKKINMADNDTPPPPSPPPPQIYIVYIN
jgi:hypothetical protein